MVTDQFVVRRTQPADAAGLKRFRCSTGQWYETEAERFIRGPLAKRVAKGFGAWVVEREGELVAVAAHDGRPHPDGGGSTITWLMVLAHRLEADANEVSAAAGLARLLKTLVADVEASGRSPYWYSLVAAENVKMRRFCERAGFVAGPIPSNKRYLFYTARFDPTPASVPQSA